MSRCQAIRTAQTKGVQPGRQRVYRCGNEAIQQIRIHQASDHPRVADGWFAVDLCYACYMRSEASALSTTLQGRHQWRRL